MSCPGGCVPQLSQHQQGPGGEPSPEQGDHSKASPPLFLAGTRALQLHSRSKLAQMVGPEECRAHPCLRHKEPFLTQAPRVRPSAGGWGVLEVTRFLLCMVKAFAEQGKHSCLPEAQHNTCRAGPVGSTGAAGLTVVPSLPTKSVMLTSRTCILTVLSRGDHLL